ncbi:MAG: Gfo/Idh/MocA family oxidoreductase [Planctomycetaceae bacterium]|jgi:myo-inositol 2-dehydrogenase/D-chiro-inositol 1-dehydrogenase|nr:Gfo/Idh/MocA family oxidoreductase [Planctomycetaceae bacterium]
MIRYAIIGLGAWGHCYADIIRKLPEVTLTAVVTGNPDTVNNIRTEYPNVTVVADYHELLQINDWDVAVVAVPNHLHFQIGLDVLNTGKHLLMEKPLALTAEDSDTLFRTAIEKGLHLTVGHQFRLSSLWGKIKELIDSDQIGVPKYAFIELSRNPYRTGENGWRYDKKQVGNWILEEPIHFFDLACWYFESFGKPVSIYASANTSLSTDKELYDNLSVIVHFSNGSHAVIAQTLAAFEHHQSVKVTGTKGSLWAGWSGVIDRTRHPSFFLKISDGNNVREINIEKPAGELFELEEQIIRMNLVIEGKAKNPCTGSDGCQAVTLSIAAQKSAQTGTLIEL